MNMIVKNIFLFLGLIVLIMTSCETVIELEFNDAEPKLVIEAVVTNEPGPYRVELNESAGFYDESVFPPRVGAVVTINDNQGFSEVLSETEPGVYLTDALLGEPGVTYTLTVETEGETYIASSTMPISLVPIDGLEVQFEEESIFLDEGYYVSVQITDPPEEGNSYRYLFFRNGEPYIYTDEDGEEDGTDSNLYITDDRFWNGNSVEEIFFNAVELGDTVTIELQHLDPETFDYYRTLIGAIEGGGVAPSDPLSNFGDRALGYFGAFSVNRMQVVIE